MISEYVYKNVLKETIKILKKMSAPLTVDIKYRKI